LTTKKSPQIAVFLAKKDFLIFDMDWPGNEPDFGDMSRASFFLALPHKQGFFCSCVIGKRRCVQ